MATPSFLESEIGPTGHGSAISDSGASQGGGGGREGEGREMGGALPKRRGFVQAGAITWAGGTIARLNLSACWRRKAGNHDSLRCSRVNRVVRAGLFPCPPGPGGHHP